MADEKKLDILDPRVKEHLEKFSKARSESLQKRIADEKANPDYKKLVATYGGLLDEPEGWSMRWQEDYLQDLIVKTDQGNLINPDSTGDYLGVKGGQNKNTDFTFSDLIPRQKLSDQIHHWISNHGSPDVPDGAWKKILDNHRKKMYMDYRIIRPGPPEGREYDKLEGYKNYFPMGSESWSREMAGRRRPGQGGYIKYGEDFPTEKQWLKTPEERDRREEELGGDFEGHYQDWQPWKGPSRSDPTAMEPQTQEEIDLGRTEGFKEWMATGQDAIRLSDMAQEGGDRWVGKDDWYWNERLNLHNAYKDWTQRNPFFDHTNQSPMIPTPEAKVPDEKRFYPPESEHFKKMVEKYKAMLGGGMSFEKARFMTELLQGAKDAEEMAEYSPEAQKWLKRMQEQERGLNPEEVRKLRQGISDSFDRATPEEQERIRKMFTKKGARVRTEEYQPPFLPRGKPKNLGPRQDRGGETPDWLKKELPLQPPGQIGPNTPEMDKPFQKPNQIIPPGLRPGEEGRNIRRGYNA